MQLSSSCGNWITLRAVEGQPQEIICSHTWLPLNLAVVSIDISPNTFPQKMSPYPMPCSFLYSEGVLGSSHCLLSSPTFLNCRHGVLGMWTCWRESWSPHIAPCNTFRPALFAVSLAGGIVGLYISCCGGYLRCQLDSFLSSHSLKGKCVWSTFSD